MVCCHFLLMCHWNLYMFGLARNLKTSHTVAGLLNGYIRLLGARLALFQIWNWCRRARPWSIDILHGLLGRSLAILVLLLQFLLLAIVILLHNSMICLSSMVRCSWNQRSLLARRSLTAVWDLLHHGCNRSAVRMYLLRLRNSLAVLLSAALCNDIVDILV